MRLRYAHPASAKQILRPSEKTKSRETPGFFLYSYLSALCLCLRAMICVPVVPVSCRRPSVRPTGRRALHASAPYGAAPFHTRPSALRLPEPPDLCSIRFSTIRSAGDRSSVRAVWCGAECDHPLDEKPPSPRFFRDRPSSILHHPRCRSAAGKSSSQHLNVSISPCRYPDTSARSVLIK